MLEHLYYNSNLRISQRTMLHDFDTTKLLLISQQTNEKVLVTIEGDQIMSIC